MDISLYEFIDELIKFKSEFIHAGRINKAITNEKIKKELQFLKL